MKGSTDMEQNTPEVFTTDAVMTALGHLPPEKAIQSLLTINMEVLVRYVTEVREEGYRAGWRDAVAQHTEDAKTGDAEYDRHVRSVGRMRTLEEVRQARGE